MNAHDDDAEDADAGKHLGRRARAEVQGDRYHHGDEGGEGEHAAQEGAEGVAIDAAIGGLHHAFELAEQDGDAEIADGPLGVGIGDEVDVEERGKVDEVQQADDGERGEGEGDDDEPPAGLEDAEGGFAVAARDGHTHLVTGDGGEAEVGEEEIAGQGVEGDPLAVDGLGPEVQEDGHLGEGDDGLRKFGDALRDEAPDEPTAGAGVDAHRRPFAKTNMLQVMLLR